MIEGHPTADFNGVYRHDSTHEGWPVLKNAEDRYCYRHASKEKWYLDDAIAPDSNTCNAFIVAKDGPLPVGGHAWRVWVADPGGKKQEGRTLTVTLQ